MRLSTWKSRLSVLASTVALLLLWKLASAVVGAEVILPSPESTFLAVSRLFAGADFWAAVGATVVRGLLGFALSLAAGVVVGCAAGYSRTIGHVVSPFLAVVRTTPMMSIILLALIWFRTDAVPVFTSFLVAFPIICGNVIVGVQNVAPELVEMARAYQVPLRRSLVHLYIPSLVPYLFAAASTAMGLTWKVVVAAEVLSQPLHAVGTGLQDAKIVLDTAGVFAWTAVAIILSAFTEGLIARASRLIPWRR
jgi:NitT/TauT family transport system permease protein